MKGKYTIFTIGIFHEQTNLLNPVGFTSVATASNNGGYLQRYAGIPSIPPMKIVVT